MTSIDTPPPPASDAGGTPVHRPYVASETVMPELTWSAVLLGAILGIVFGASSLYLVLKVGLTVSASIPVAVLSITLFRIISKAAGLRKATILENNIVQTTGSAGESIAFGVGVTIPALMLLGFDMDVVRVMTVGVLGGLLGILMMIPLRRAFIVRQHGKLPYPEGTACADVLIVGEQGGSTARTVFAGFGIAFVYKIAYKVLALWNEELNIPLFNSKGEGLKNAVLGAEVSPELLGVGYIIGPKIAYTMLAGGALAYLVLVPVITYFSANQSGPIAPETTKLVSEMSGGQIRNAYILYIGAGAVATGGVISMFRVLPLMFRSFFSSIGSLKSKSGANGGPPRTDRDLPIGLVVFGVIALIAALTFVLAPGQNIAHSAEAIGGAALIVFFGFLFVTVSSRLTGEIGSSSNPISGMTVATLLFTCLVFLLLGRTQKPATLTAITVAAVVCIASANAGATAQDLKTGFLVGATPYRQQIGILVGALTSALVMGGTLLMLNNNYTIYSRKNLPQYQVPDVKSLISLERPGGQYKDDARLYHVLNLAEGERSGVPQGKYLVDDAGQINYLVDPGINGRLIERDDKTKVEKFEAPKTRLMALIIQGIMNRKLPWGLVLLGVLISISVELLGVSSLPFAVGVYLPIQTSLPIFIGGVLRWIVGLLKKHSSAESEMSGGTLLSTGYIAGGTIGGVLIAAIAPFDWKKHLLLGQRISDKWPEMKTPSAVAFGILVVILLITGLSSAMLSKKTPANGSS